MLTPRPIKLSAQVSAQQPCLHLICISLPLWSHSCSRCSGRCPRGLTYFRGRSYKRKASTNIGRGPFRLGLYISPITFKASYCFLVRHIPNMGLAYNIYLNSHRIYGCKNCKTHLSNHDDIISRVSCLYFSLEGELGPERRICPCWAALADLHTGTELSRPAWQGLPLRFCR